jgi:uncharacterized damage-inducible protein DinB
MQISYDPVRVFRKLGYNNLLANLRLHDACATLMPGEFEAPRSGFFPSIKATLNHILLVDRFYIDALKGGRLGVAVFVEAEPYCDLADIRHEQAALDAGLVTLLDQMTPQGLEHPVHIHRDARVQIERFDDVLSHLFQHQTHHRGQVHAMLSSTSIKPPQLDEFIVADDAAARVGEMQALGWSEEFLMSAGA